MGSHKRKRRVYVCLALLFLNRTQGLDSEGSVLSDITENADDPAQLCEVSNSWIKKVFTTQQNGVRGA